MTERDLRNRMDFDIINNPLSVTGKMGIQFDTLPEMKPNA